MEKEREREGNISGTNVWIKYEYKIEEVRLEQNNNKLQKIQTRRKKTI